jgi:hypothetical protein
MAHTLFIAENSGAGAPPPVVVGKYVPSRNTFSVAAVGAATTTYYRMRGRDTVCIGASYAFWVVTGAPDTTGANCPPGNLVCGANPLTDLTDICIVARWVQQS